MREEIQRLIPGGDRVLPGDVWRGRLAQRWTDYGTQRMTRRQYREAIHCFEQALRIDPARVLRDE